MQPVGDLPQQAEQGFTCIGVDWYHNVRGRVGTRQCDRIRHVAACVAHDHRGRALPGRQRDVDRVALQSRTPEKMSPHPVDHGSTADQRDLVDPVGRGRGVHQPPRSAVHPVEALQRRPAGALPKSESTDLEPQVEVVDRDVNRRAATRIGTSQRTDLVSNVQASGVLASRDDDVTGAVHTRAPQDDRLTSVADDTQSPDRPKAGQAGVLRVGLDDDHTLAKLHHRLGDGTGGLGESDDNDVVSGEEGDEQALVVVTKEDRRGDQGCRSERERGDEPRDSQFPRGLRFRLTVHGEELHRPVDGIEAVEAAGERVPVADVTENECHHCRDRRPEQRTAPK